MPRPRKTPRYPDIIPVLIRDAQPLWQEIEGEQDPVARADAEARRTIALDRLVSIYLDHRKRGKLPELDQDIREICERLAAENGGRLPRPRGGAPSQQDLHLRIHVAVVEALSAPSTTPRTADSVLHEVASRFGRSYEVVRDIYHRSDSKWLRAVDVELAFRARQVGSPTAVIGRSKRAGPNRKPKPTA